MPTQTWSGMAEITERMDAALAQLHRNWPTRTAKAFYLGPADWDEFMATNPAEIATTWNNEPVMQPGFKGVPVRPSKNVPPRLSKLYDHTSGGHKLPGCEVLPDSIRQRLDEIDYAEIERVLDERSRTRALTDLESSLLEAAIRKLPISLRECARLGVKRIMGVHRQ